MSSPSEYTVGWICAIPCEHVAAQSFLDKRHDHNITSQLNDNNNYTLGRTQDECCINE